MKMKGSRIRKKTRPIRVGKGGMGGDFPVSIQSMTNLPIENIEGTVRQINALYKKGASFVRLAVKGIESVTYLKKIIASVEVPLIADIHFNYKIAVESIKAGVSKIRINPGNIGDAGKVREVVKAARDYSVPIRIGVNGGSIDRKKYPEGTPADLVESAIDQIRILEEMDFHEIAVSIKSSDPFLTIEANRLLSLARDYPIHVGLTEAGYGLSCMVQSSIVIGHLLMLGIGDTIRVSMTGDPVDEIAVACKILETTGDITPALRIVACPTCGRTDEDLDLRMLAEEIEKECNDRFSSRLAETGRTLTVAVMGCEVNGPGEASEADLGIAGAGKGHMILFARSGKIGRIKSCDALAALIKEVEKILPSPPAPLPK